MRSFFGWTSYYLRFVKDVASHIYQLKTLTNLTKKKRMFKTIEEAFKSLDDLSTCLIIAPVLRGPNFNKQFKLYTDACDYWIGAVVA